MLTKNFNLKLGPLPNFGEGCAKISHEITFTKGIWVIENLIKASGFDILWRKPIRLQNLATKKWLSPEEIKIRKEYKKEDIRKQLIRLIRTKV